LKFLFNDGNQHVGRHGAPDLRLYGVLAVAKEFLDSQVLFDPFEEQFDLPAVFVKCCNCQCWQDKVVGQKDQCLACLWVLESNPSQVLWVVLRGIESSEQHRLVANDAGCSVCRSGVNPPRIHVDFGPRDEKSARSMHRIEPSEVQVTTVHHVEGASLDRHEVEYVDLVHLSVADVDKRWDCAPQVQKRVQLDSAFGFAKRSPIEQAQTQIDRGCVQRVNGVLQVESDQVRVAVELACATNQQCSDVRPNAPIARFVGIGQRRAMNAVTQSHRIKFARIGPKRYLDIAKTLAPRQLRKGHHAKLLGAGHATNARVASVAIDDATKARPWHELHNLRKKRLADIHERSPRG